MSRSAILCFEHDRRIQREIEPSCFDLDIDVRVPWEWVEASMGEVRVDQPEQPESQTFDGTIVKIARLAATYQPACPACKELLRCTSWSIEDLKDDAEGS